MRKIASPVFAALCGLLPFACNQSPNLVTANDGPVVRATTTQPYVTTRPGQPGTPQASQQQQQQQQLPSAPPPTTAPVGPLPGGGVAPSRPSNGQSSQGGLIANIIGALGGGTNNNNNDNEGGTKPPSSPSSPTTPPSPSSGGDNYQLCMKTINDYRATVGSPALTLNSAKNGCSDEQTGKDGQGGGAHANFGECGESAQDECPGWGDGDQAEALTGCLKMMWDEGPGGGHYENMKNAQYRSVACGFKLVNGSVWMVQNFYP